VPERFDDGTAVSARLHSPSCQSSFSRHGITLDPVHRLPGEPSGPGDLANARGFAQERLGGLELLAAVAGLASLISPNRAKAVYSTFLKPHPGLWTSLGWLEEAHHAYRKGEFGTDIADARAA
jgi:hypothetical protein